METSQDFLVLKQSLSIDNKIMEPMSNNESTKGNVAHVKADGEALKESLKGRHPVKLKKSEMEIFENHLV